MVQAVGGHIRYTLLLLGQDQDLLLPVIHSHWTLGRILFPLLIHLFALGVKAPLSLKMYSNLSLTLAALSLLAGSANAAAINERATTTTTCANNALAKLMVYFPAYAAPFCSALNINAVTPHVTITATPTV